jgi:hypothetical protein
MEQDLQKMVDEAVEKKFKAYEEKFLEKLDEKLEEKFAKFVKALGCADVSSLDRCCRKETQTSGRTRSDVILYHPGSMLVRLWLLSLCAPALQLTRARNLSCSSIR